MTALELAAAIRAGELSAREALDACLDAVDRTNDEVNAVIWRDDDAARATADALDGSALPFGGVPIPVKDLNLAVGQPAYYGSRGSPEGPRDEDEAVIAAFRRAGFIPTGRTNVPEFGLIPIAENLRFGVSRNPWNTDHTPGGSSGGAAAAVAAGMFPAAHANDGGGSIRIPASCCGLVGLKPSRGRVPKAVQSLGGRGGRGRRHPRRRGHRSDPRRDRSRRRGRVDAAAGARAPLPRRGRSGPGQGAHRADGDRAAGAPDRRRNAPQPHATPRGRSSSWATRSPRSTCPRCRRS